MGPVALRPGGGRGHELERRNEAQGHWCGHVLSAMLVASPVGAPITPCLPQGPGQGRVGSGVWLPRRLLLLPTFAEHVTAARTEPHW